MQKGNQVKTWRFNPAQLFKDYVVMRLGLVYGLAIFSLTTGCVKTMGNPASLREVPPADKKLSNKTFERSESPKARSAPSNASENGWLVSIPGIDAKLLQETNQVTVTLLCKDGSQVEMAASRDDWFQIDNDGIYILIRELCPAMQFRVNFPDFATDWIDLPPPNGQNDDSNFAN